MNPRTPLECKFSVPFCIALGLRGYRVVAPDFSVATMGDAAVTELMPLIELEVVQDQPQYEAHLEVHVEGEAPLRADTDIVLGHAQNPMSEEDFNEKFRGLVDPVLGPQKSARLYACLNRFGQAGTLREIMELLDNGA
jgi:2-methylcitrate dehydratase PrpD